MNLKNFFLPNKWKAKAKQSTKEKKALKKRVKELSISRDNFRNKYYTLKEEQKKTEKERLFLEKELKKS